MLDQSHRQSLSNQVPIHSWVERVHMQVKCLAQEHNAATPQQRVEPGSLNLNSTALTTASRRPTDDCLVRDSCHEVPQCKAVGAAPATPAMAGPLFSTTKELYHPGIPASNMKGMIGKPKRSSAIKATEDGEVLIARRGGVQNKQSRAVESRWHHKVKIYLGETKEPTTGSL